MNLLVTVTLTNEGITCDNNDTVIYENDDDDGNLIMIDDV